MLYEVITVRRAGAGHERLRDDAPDLVLGHGRDPGAVHHWPINLSRTITARRRRIGSYNFV